MKSRHLLFALLIAAPSVALAGLKLPSKIYQEADLEKAKAEAVTKNKPLSILYTDKDSTCPLCNSASNTMIKELGNKTIMVYVRDINGLPESVKNALREGKYIPKIAVFDDKMEKALGTVTYESVKEDSRKAFREVDRAIKDYKKAE
jgi:hypothetical protein